MGGRSSFLKFSGPGAGVRTLRFIAISIPALKSEKEPTLTSPNEPAGTPFISPDEAYRKTIGNTGKSAAWADCHKRIRHRLETNAIPGTEDECDCLAMSDPALTLMQQMLENAGYTNVKCFSRGGTTPGSGSRCIWDYPEIEPEPEPFGPHP